MSANWARRTLLGAAGAVMPGAFVREAAGQAPGVAKIKILGVACSPRKGMTTAAAVRACLEGAVAVGAARNGGQDLTLQTIHASMRCQDMIIVSDGRPTARQAVGHA